MPYLTPRQPAFLSNGDQCHKSRPLPRYTKNCTLLCSNKNNLLTGKREGQTLHEAGFWEGRNQRQTGHPMDVHTLEPSCSPTVPRLPSLPGTRQRGWVRQGATGRPWLLRRVLCTLASTPEQLSSWMCAASPPLQCRSLCNSWPGWSGMDTRRFSPHGPVAAPKPHAPCAGSCPVPRREHSEEHKRRH